MIEGAYQPSTSKVWAMSEMSAHLVSMHFKPWKFSHSQAEKVQIRTPCDAKGLHKFFEISNHLAHVLVQEIRLRATKYSRLAILPLAE